MRRPFRFGRGRRIRTLGTRFWRPLLYHLSYAPKNQVPAYYKCFYPVCQPKKQDFLTFLQKPCVI